MLLQTVVLALHGEKATLSPTLSKFKNFHGPHTMETPTKRPGPHEESANSGHPGTSIGVGEGSPTHQPIEHLAALRAIPHLTVLRPADSNKVAEAWPRRLVGTVTWVSMVGSLRGPTSGLRHR